MHKKNRSYRVLQSSNSRSTNKTGILATSCYFRNCLWEAAFGGKVNPAFPGSRTECDFILLQGEACVLLEPATPTSSPPAPTARTHYLPVYIGNRAQRGGADSAAACLPPSPSAAPGTGCCQTQPVPSRAQAKPPPGGSAG